MSESSPPDFAIDIIGNQKQLQRSVETDCTLHAGDYRGEFNHLKECVYMPMPWQQDKESHELQQ